MLFASWFSFELFVNFTVKRRKDVCCVGLVMILNVFN
jgi:hypothetical protein